MYYRLVENPNPEYGITEGSEVALEVALDEGKPVVREVREPVVFTVDMFKQDSPQDYYDVGSWGLVVSDSLLDAFSRAGVKNIQIFKAALLNKKTSARWDNYSVVNITEAIDCVDKKKSTEAVRGDAGESPYFEVCIDEKKAKDALLFRLADSLVDIIVHESVVHKITAHIPAFTGIQFQILDGSIGREYEKGRENLSKKLGI